jgi:hypothetical protein
MKIISVVDTRSGVVLKLQYDSSTGTYEINGAIVKHQSAFEQREDEVVFAGSSPKQLYHIARNDLDELRDA